MANPSIEKAEPRDQPVASVRSQGSFLDRTFVRLVNLWRDLSDSVSGTVDATLSSEGDVRRLREQMQACLEGRGGEVSARARAAALGRTYLGLDELGRERFLRILAGSFDADRSTVDSAIAAVTEAGSAERPRAEAALRAALEPPRMRLLTQFNALPQGVKFLVDLRADLMKFSRRDETLGALDADLRRLLASWFDIGFLDLRQITWDSPATVLEKLIAYEAVHEIHGWEDLKNRLDSDRRCFAFFHPRMPDEPLIFVEVALVDGMAENIAALLDQSAPVVDPARNADTAIFYSISNAQKGLAGISFGGFLIKRVVDLLAAEFSGLKTFATLSPIPNFCRWLERQMSDGVSPLLPAEAKSIRAATGLEEGVEQLRGILASEHWFQDEKIASALRDPLMRLCAQYLLNEKGRAGRALDPVAHFHLTNGARLERLNWLGDTSKSGLERSAGLMVNYLYELDRIEENHESYTGDGSVTASAAVTRLLKS
ncbi:MAG: malonyl-CoA decarboxylase [Alphaproteobacteria bacterium]|nr:malonyl-CoA decarboxylase [Alphaproteobacteria bacterium]